MEVATEELRWELRLPIAGEVAPWGPNPRGLGVGRAETVEVAAIIHKGPYSEVGQTYRELQEWIGKNGYGIAGPAQEVYLNDARTTPPGGAAH